MCLAVHGAELSVPGALGSLFNRSQFHFAPPSSWSSSSTPTVTPPSVQPLSPPTVVSTSLAADLEGLTLTDSPLVPSVSEMGKGLDWGRDTCLCCIPWCGFVCMGV